MSSDHYFTASTRRKRVTKVRGFVGQVIRVPVNSNVEKFLALQGVNQNM